MSQKSSHIEEVRARLELLKDLYRRTLGSLRVRLTRNYYEAQIQLKRRTWPWHLRVPGPLLKNHQHRFYAAMFGLLAEIAAADGAVNAAEREAVQDFATDNLRLSAHQVITALKFFRETRDSGQTFESRVAELYSMFRLRPDLRRNVVDALIDMAYSDKILNEHEDRLIVQAVVILKLNRKDYIELMEEHAAEEALRSKLFQFEDELEEKTRRTSAGLGADPTQSLIFTSSHYDTLGCASTDSASVIKRRYRKLVLQHHPDRLAAQGLPEEFRETAKKKFQEIQAAYEAIEEERGFR